MREQRGNQVRPYGVHHPADSPDNWVVQSKNGRDIAEYRTIKEAETCTNINTPNICRVLDKQGTAGGYEWRHGRFGDND